MIAAHGKEFAKSGELDPKYHRYLIQAQELRQTGDYGHEMVISSGNVQQALEWAGEFFAAAKAYFQESVGR